MVKMNNLISWQASGVLAVMALALLACGGQNDRGEAAVPVPASEGQTAQGEPLMHFDTVVHDFGTIIEGESVVCYFDYTNRGGGDLVITAVEATCGCTVPSWSSEPLKPGANETFQLIFDASGRNGEQIKQVMVNSNASNEVVRLTINAKGINSVS